MLSNIQRYFRFYLAFLLFGILFIGVRWENATASEAPAKPAPAAAKPAPAAARGAVASR